MSLDRIYVTIIGCDDCDGTYYFEDKWGQTYFEDQSNAVDEARKDGWEIGGGHMHATAVCPYHVKKRKRADRGIPEPEPEIPGQLAIDGSAVVGVTR